jgi:hypothetical protein
MGRVIARRDGSWWPSSLKLLLPLKDADFLVFHEPGGSACRWLDRSTGGGRAQ